MGRKVEPRESYEKEVLILLRMTKVVQADENHDDEWKSGVCGDLNAAARKLLTTVEGV